MTSLSDALTSNFSTSLSQLVDKAFQGAVSGSKEGANIVATRFAVGFERYIASTRSRCINVKTLISSSSPIQLSQAYEPADLTFGDIKIPIDKFISELGTNRNHALITATLGAGKSFTMRYIYSQFSEPGILSHIPIFIELRDIQFSERTLVSYIFDAISPFTNFVSERSIISGLKSGVFCLILDGFDEISGRNQRAADQQINKIVSDYPNNIVVVSSRPNRTRFMSWHNFPEYAVAPLTLPKLESLVNRIDFDETDKGLFLKRVKGSLFESHENILSNPLLASMMLLTFKEFQDIPSKMHVFYGTAFDVLYRRHDTIKPDYQREFKSGLDLNDFKRLFMTFCFMSFLDRKFTFNSSTFSYYISRAIEYEEMDVKVSDICDDLNHNICIMHTEGDDINFMHRSFQEYFAGLFLSKRSIEDAYRYIDFLFCEVSTHDFFRMLIEIDREEFERKYLIEKIKQLDDNFARSRTLGEKIEVLASSFICGALEMSQVRKRFSFLLDLRRMGRELKLTTSFL